MTQLTRRQVTKAAAWSAPVIAVAAAAPAASASQGTDYCGCFLPAAMSFEQGRWRAQQAIDGVSWHINTKMTLARCASLDDYYRQYDSLYLNFVVSHLDVQTTDGQLNDVTSTDLLGERVSGSLPITTDMHFVSPGWTLGSTAGHHITSVTATVQARLTNGADSYDQLCPTSMTFAYTLGPDQFGNWDGNSGLSTVTVS